MGWGQEKSDLLLEFSPLKNSKIMEEGIQPFLSHCGTDTSFIMIADAEAKNETNGIYHNEHLYKFSEKHEFFASFYTEKNEKFVISCVYSPNGVTLKKYKIRNQNLVLISSKKTKEVLEPFCPKSNFSNSEYSIFQDYTPDMCSSESNYIKIFNADFKEVMEIEPFKNELFDYASYEWVSPTELVLYVQLYGGTRAIKKIKVNVKERTFKELMSFDLAQYPVSSINESKDKNRLIIQSIDNSILIYNSNIKKIENRLNGIIYDVLYKDSSCYFLTGYSAVGEKKRIIIYSFDKNGAIVKYDTGFERIKHPYFLAQSGKDVYLRNGDELYNIKNKFQKKTSSALEKLDIIGVSNHYSYLFVRNLTKNKIQIYKR
jgi:WD40 repeat protein